MPEAIASASVQSPDRPDFKCPEYQETETRWMLCQDVKQGTEAIRARRESYLPKFEAEDVLDWDTRVRMSYVNDHYAQTVHDLVGMVFAKPPLLDEDVPDELKQRWENIDGQGTHWEVFAQRALDVALDWGHAVLLTDYPPVQQRPTLTDAKSQGLRAYATLYRPDDVMSWRTVTVGGVTHVVQIVLREQFYEDNGAFGQSLTRQYRVLRQDVVRDEQGTATGLGGVTWQVWREVKDSTTGQLKLMSLDEPRAFSVAKKGALDHIPIRVVYGGEKLGTLFTRPHLMGLAYLNLQETQVISDLTSIIHKCNVPTPVFIGRPAARAGTANKSVRMGSGIDLPTGADAKMLEPQGSAIESTQKFIDDIRAQMRRQGAYLNEPTTALTATEAAMFARQRNARLARAARSLQDAMEGVLSDFALFEGVSIVDRDKDSNDGGSIVVNTDFAGAFDVQFVQVALQAYAEGAIPLDVFLTVMQTGKMPDDFDAEDLALRLASDAAAKEQAKNDAIARGLAAQGNGGMMGGSSRDAGDGGGSNELKFTTQRDANGKLSGFSMQRGGKQGGQAR